MAEVGERPVLPAGPSGVGIRALPGPGLHLRVEIGRVLVREGDP